MARTLARISGKSSPNGTMISTSSSAAWPTACAIAMSASLEVRLSFFVERIHAFQAVFGADHAVVGLDFEGKAGGQIGLQPKMDRLLGLAHRDRRVVADRAGGRDRAGHQLGRLAHGVDHAPAMRLVGGE